MVMIKRKLQCDTTSLINITYLMIWLFPLCVVFERICIYTKLNLYRTKTQKSHYLKWLTTHVMTLQMTGHSTEQWKRQWFTCAQLCGMKNDMKWCNSWSPLFGINKCNYLLRKLHFKNIRSLWLSTGTLFYGCRIE